MITTSEPNLAARLTALADAAEAYRLARPSAPGSEREAVALDIAIGRIRAALAAANPEPVWKRTNDGFDAALRTAFPPDVEIRATNPYGFRFPEWAVVTGVEWVRNRPCFSVRFPDGVTDSWVIRDPNDSYEFRARSPLPKDQR